MLAVVKTPHIEITINGIVDNSLKLFLKKQYGNKFKIIDKDSELTDVTKSDWYKKIKLSSTPGKKIRLYRLNQNMTQDALGRALGNFKRHHVSEMESGKRGVSKETAIKLSKLFKKPIENFL